MFFESAVDFTISLYNKDAGSPFFVELSFQNQIAGVFQ